MIKLFLLLCLWCGTTLSQRFASYGLKGKKLAEKGGLDNLEQAVHLFQQQKKAASAKRQAFTAMNNIAVTMLRIGNLKQPALNSVNAYLAALENWRKCLKLHKKSKKIIKNLQLLEATCSRRFHGAPNCDEALKENSPFQQSPKFLRSLFKGNVVAVDAHTGSSSWTSHGSGSGSSSAFDDIYSSKIDALALDQHANVEDEQKIYASMSLLITKGIKNIRAYKKKVLLEALEEDVDKYGERDNSNNNGQGVVAVELGSALLHFTKAAGLYTHLIQTKNGGPTTDTTTDTNDYIAAINNIAAIYLIMATTTLDTIDMNRDVIVSTQKLVQEAERLLATNPSMPELTTSVSSPTQTAKWTKSVAINLSIIARMKQQTHQELAALRGDSLRSSGTTADSDTTGTTGTTPPTPPPPRTPQFPPVDRIKWPPSRSHLSKYGFTSLPTVGAYVRQRNTPVVIENTNTNNYVNTWPQLQHKWSNTSYLEQHLNPLLMVSMTDSASNLYGTDKMNSRMNTGEFFQRLHQMNQTKGVPHDGKYPYISIDINHDHIKSGGVLEDDLTTTNFHDVSTGYIPIGNQMKLILWIGASNVTAVGHYDHAFNCFLMLRGSKRFIVAPPSSSIDLYFHPAPSNSHRQSQMRNYDAIDPDVYPRALKVPFQEAKVLPGEIMYLPPLWIHSVESTSGPSVALSAWSYPGDVLSCISELSNNFRDSTQQVLNMMLTMTVSERLKIKIHRATYFSFVLRVLVKVYDQGVPPRTVVGDGSAHDFVAALLESKYNNEHSVEAGCSVKATCPNHNDVLLLPSLLDQAIEKEAVRRARMLGAEGVEHSPLKGMLEVGAHVPLMMASVEYLSHVGLSYGRMINHGDEAGTKVCDFIHSCLLPVLKRRGEEEKVQQ